MDLSQTERNYALEWENVPKATRAKKHWRDRKSVV